MSDTQFYDELIDDFERQLIDGSLTELENYVQRSADLSPNKESVLVAMLSAGGGDFPINERCRYQSQQWVFDSKSIGTTPQVPFNHLTPGANTLKRALSFYRIPEFSYHNIKSYRTTATRSRDFIALEKFLFIANHLTCLPEHIRLITPKMINQALDMARDSEAKSNYFTLFTILRFWSALSVQKLIPEPLRLDVPLSHFNYEERRRDVIAVHEGSIQSWVPFSEQELQSLIEYALFWLEKALPVLLDFNQRLLDSGLLERYPKGKIDRYSRDAALERLFHIEVEGEVLMEIARTDSSRQGRPAYLYTWKTRYAEMLDHVRNAIFILVALLTGARSSELAPLQRQHLRNERPDQSGDFWLQITRWKTSSDPNYNGQTEELPLPRFAAEAILSLYKLKELAGFEQARFLFQSNAGRRANIKADPQLLRFVVNQIAENTGVQHIHPHRFRKSIAEILINRDERNIDIIRALFGHKSYDMTLKYIARNPAMVRCIAAVLEQNFTADFQEIVSQIRYGVYSGEVADRIAQHIQARPLEFTGSQLKLTLHNYIIHILRSGSPLLIKRTALGTYCVTAEKFSDDNAPPCIAGNAERHHEHRPNPSNCDYTCRKIVVFLKAKQALEDNIHFYEKILADQNCALPAPAKRQILDKISAYRAHLSNLSAPHNIAVVELSHEQ
ncbi:tyrosine-type recombinase/integrase [Pseudomonas sp. B21-040]|uniref:tyrosine-type recombinase/integrase n=1 Tax=Pseudomonas sp. B21-040 TaxID=2895486 RepID=UPI00215EB593|nr:tyrosine-type recombinase/integrase [Pseudomonas sp. B21-040]UVL38326.1 tyrosine-type recombinase/integrase [Pseudomonas sp. B21-040]